MSRFDNVREKPTTIPKTIGFIFTAILSVDVFSHRIHVSALEAIVPLFLTSANVIMANVDEFVMDHHHGGHLDGGIHHEDRRLASIRTPVQAVLMQVSDFAAT